MNAKTKRQGQSHKNGKPETADAGESQRQAEAIKKFGDGAPPKSGYATKKEKARAGGNTSVQQVVAEPAREQSARRDDVRQFDNNDHSDQRADFVDNNGGTRPVMNTSAELALVAARPYVTKDFATFELYTPMQWHIVTDDGDVIVRHGSLIDHGVTTYVVTMSSDPEFESGTCLIKMKLLRLVGGDREYLAKGPNAEMHRTTANLLLDVIEEQEGLNKVMKMRTELSAELDGARQREERLAA